MAKNENEGEGSKSADKNYREGATKFAKTHDVEKEARAAEEEVEADPKTFSDAEKAGKAPGKGDDLPTPK